MAGETPPAPAHVGDVYETTLVRESSQQGDGSSGTTYDKDTITERVIDVGPDGVELEYNLPKDATKEERAVNWQFPVRVFRHERAPLEVLNRSELEARVDRWLKAAKWPRTVCGHWIFTWNAFRIECDPQSVIKTIEAFDLGSADVREGASYQEAGARAPGTLAKRASSSGGTTLAVELEADPDAVRRARAESDVALGEIMRKPVTLEAALREHAKETVAGTISVTFETDLTGMVRRKIVVTKLQTQKPSGSSQTETVTRTLERRLVAGQGPNSSQVTTAFN